MLGAIFEDTVSRLENNDHKLFKSVEYATKLLAKYTTDDFEQFLQSDSHAAAMKSVLVACCSILSNVDDQHRGIVLKLLSLISNKISISELTTYIGMESFELFFRLSIIELQHLLMTEESNSDNDIYTYFLLLDEYLDLFLNEKSAKNQVLLTKVTNDLLERLESQLTALVAVLSGVLQFSKSNEITLATCKFLASWLQCEMRAVTSHAIAENLLQLCLFVKERDVNIFGAFLSGFFKATDSEKGAFTYFESTELVKICRNCMIHKMDERVQEIAANILLEYLIYMEQNEKRDKYNWTKYSAIAMKSNVDMAVKVPLVLKTMMVSDDCFNINDLTDVVKYLQAAFVNGKLNESYVDPDIPGTQQDWHTHIFKSQNIVYTG